MGGDYTKFTFKPQRDYAGVFKQQGRVDLDADWNELVQIFDRRWRAETIDIIGRAVVPNSTPDAFKITPTGPGAFTIGLGRMYVDGLLAENHGVDPESRFDPILGETYSLKEVPYNDQPYLPQPLPPALAGVAATTDLIYLDVWQREVTYIEDPDIKEIALEGPDTATRVQTVWQVGDLQNVGDHQCSDSIKAWDDLVAPSAGQLTTSVLAPPPSSDPCIISASGGYRGLENRLYRVEVHTEGGLGVAKFKWSRDDASITSAVTSISGAGPYQVTVKRIGRDQVLRFQIGDWVEVLDDYTEFQHQAGQMGSVTGIDEANQVLTVAFTNAGALAGFDPTNAKRHTRIRRWDEKNSVDANGLLTVAAGPLDIEDGIQVSFSLDPNITSNKFKIGDYWLFAARTTDGSIEALNQAPPRGILHHYCRLGFLTWPGTFSDCRQHWPPAGDCACCTVTVGDGIDSHGQFTDIQQAIDALGSGGGLVCIGRGVYVVTETIKLSAIKSGVIIRGMGPATRIIFAPGSPNFTNFMEIDGAQYVRIEDIFVAGAASGSLIEFLSTSFCAVEKCLLVNLGEERGLTHSAQLATAVAVNGASIGLTIRESLLMAPVAASFTDIRDLNFRDNIVVSLQSGVFIEQGENLEFIHNHLRGILLEEWLKLQEEGNQLVHGSLGTQRSLVTSFQNLISELLKKSGVDALGLTGIVIHSGKNVKMERNAIAARVGILAFLLAEADLVENEMLAYLGIFLFVGLLVRLRDNEIGGLLFGLLQLGVSFGLQCDGNAWLGYFGIALGAPADFPAATLEVLDKIFPGFSSMVKDAGTLTGLPDTLGMTITAKISANIFASFLFGIYKSDASLSGDLDIVNNTFLLCAKTGVFLGEAPSFRTGFSSGADATTIAPPFIFSPHHLIEGNTFLVEGQGVSTAARDTTIESNTIECAGNAIGIAAGECKIIDNVLFTKTRGARAGIGMITVDDGSQSLEISGNELLNGPGHGILINTDVVGLMIDDNVIVNFQLNGIATASNITKLSQLRISRNTIGACHGDSSNPTVRPGGAVVLGQTLEASITGNIIQNNLIGTAGAALYCNVLTASEILNNTIENNADVPTAAALQGAIWLLSAQGSIRIQGNTVRGNGGPALVAVSTQSNPSSFVVQNNMFALSDNTPGVFIALFGAETVQFQANECTDPKTPAVFPLTESNGVIPPPFPLILLQALNTVIMNDNKIRAGLVQVSSPPRAGQTLINANVIFAGVGFSGVRGIITSNLAITPFPPQPGFVIANNLP